MKITVLGSGTFIPELKRHPSSYLFGIKNEKIIFDFGRGAIDNLIKMKVNLNNINNFFITHLHVDHLAELSSFLFYVLYRSGAKKYPDVKIYGPKGIKKTMNYLFKAHYLDNHKYIRKIKVKELKNNEIILYKDFSVQAIKVEHAPELYCFAYRIKAEKRIICYSGDTGYCEGIKKACKDADLAILEADLPKYWNIKAHLTGEEAGKIASESNVKRLILTHVANFYLKDVKKDVRRHYKGRVDIARDLMEIKI